LTQDALATSEFPGTLAEFVVIASASEAIHLSVENFRKDGLLRRLRRLAVTVLGRSVSAPDSAGVCHWQSNGSPEQKFFCCFIFKKSSTFQ
jgi:hypothetical protein